MVTSAHPVVPAPGQYAALRAGERLEAGSGILFAALVVVYAVLMTDTPGTDTSLDELSAFVADHRGRILAATYLNAVATLPFLWFAALLRAVLWRAEGGEGRLANLAFGMAVTAAATSLLEVGPLAAAAFWIGDQPTPDAMLIRALYDLGVIGGYLTAVLLAGFLGSAALLIQRTGCFTRYVAWLGYATAGIFLLGGAGMLDYGSALWTLRLAGALPLLVWIVAISVSIMRRA